MHDRELYARILGVTPPWRVEDVELKAQAGEIHVRLGWERGSTLRCPECGAPCSTYDSRERSWRHLDTCQYRTYLHAAVPRVECPTHGVRQIGVPWAESGSQFTALFECLAIDWMKAASVSAVARQLQMSWDEAWGIMQRAVRRGLARREREVVPHLGVDEKSFQRRHEYVTVVNDLQGQRVLFVADDRKQESLDGFFAELTPAQRDGIEAIALDMWEPYIQSVEQHVPDGGEKIVFDKFHIVKHLNEAVDRVRRQEAKALKAQGDERLTGTKYDWLRRPKHFSRQDWREFAALRESRLKVARAWAMKETILPLWEYRSAGAARRLFRQWYFWATHSRLTPMIEKARMLKTHLANILSYLVHRITNAVSEGLNAKIQWITYTARGFRNRKHFRAAIYFHCGGLDLYPH